MKKTVLLSLLLVAMIPTSTVFAQQPYYVAPLPTDSLGALNQTPDSPLWGLQTAFENINVALTTNQTAKAGLEVKLAQQKLSQIQLMLQKGDTTDAQKAQSEHDKEINDVESIADSQGSDNHGQQVSTYVHQLIADHEQNIGRLVSQFAQNTTSTQTNPQNQAAVSFIQAEKTNTDSIRSSHGDIVSANPSVKASR